MLCYDSLQCVISFRFRLYCMTLSRYCSTSRSLYYAQSTLRAVKIISRSLCSEPGKDIILYRSILLLATKIRMIHQVHYPAGSLSEMFLEPYILNRDSGGVCRQAESAKSRSFPCLLSQCSSVRLSPRFRQGSEIQSITTSAGSGAITASICQPRFHSIWRREDTRMSEEDLLSLAFALRQAVGIGEHVRHRELRARVQGHG